MGFIFGSSNCSEKPLVTYLILGFISEALWGCWVRAVWLSQVLFGWSRLAIGTILGPSWTFLGQVWSQDTPVFQNYPKTSSFSRFVDVRKAHRRLPGNKGKPSSPLLRRVSGMTGEAFGVGKVRAPAESEDSGSLLLAIESASAKADRWQKW